MVIETITLAASIFCHSHNCSVYRPQWLRVDDSTDPAKNFSIPNLFAPSGQMFAVKPTTSVPIPKGHFSRPPRITYPQIRDAYARAVLKAFQQTMPKLTGVVCRITLRLKITEDGKLSSVELTKKSADEALNQLMVSAAKRASPPLPPFGLTEADRTFTMTYVYE